jgi:hypothetical protein
MTMRWHTLHIALPAAILILLCACGHAAMYFEDHFETMDARWAKNASRGATVEIAPGGVTGNCLKIVGAGGTDYLSTRLAPETYAGKSILIRAQVKLLDVKQGSQVFSTAKLQVTQKVPGDPRAINAAARWVGTTDWMERTLAVDIRPDAAEITLNLGLQDTTGTALYDDLVVEDNPAAPPVAPRGISLKDVANTGRSDGAPDDGRGGFIDAGMHDLFALPAGALAAGNVAFNIPALGDNGAATCVVLRGKQRPGLPAQAGPIAVGRKVKALLFLQAASWADIPAQEPCLTYSISYDDGQTTDVLMRAGVDVGNFDQPAEYANYKQAWKGSDGFSQPVAVGYARWSNPRPEVAVKSLTIRSAGNGVPIVLAIGYE